MLEEVIVLEEDKQNKGLDDEVDQKASESIGLSGDFGFSSPLLLWFLNHLNIIIFHLIKSTLSI